MIKGLFIDPTAEYGQNLFLKYQINSGKNQTADDTEQNGTSDTFMGILFFICSKTDTDKSTTAIANHYSNSKSHHCQRKNNRICRIAIGTQIACIGNKNLVNNVI